MNAPAGLVLLSLQSNRLQSVQQASFVGRHLILYACLIVRLLCVSRACSFEDAGGVLSWVEQKIAAVTLLPVTHGEVRAALR